MTKKSNYFFCYSKRLSDFLQKENIQFITVAKDVKTDRFFSLYEIDNKGILQNAIDKYRNR